MKPEKPELNGAATAEIPLLLAAFTPICRKVRFPTEEATIDGCGVLDESGGLEILEGDVFGVLSERQIGLLKERDIPFEVVE